MRFRMIGKILGMLLMIFSLSMLTPIAVGHYYHDHDMSAFWTGFIITVFVGFVLWFLNRRARDELRTRDGFLVVFLMWFVLGVFGALPFMLSHHPDMTLSKAVFESLSGLTTSGATALTQIDGLPRSILYYRQQLQFLGGMGIIVLAVAIMPMIGVGGMQLYKAETTGPMKDNKLTPRITETAKALWLIYVGLNIVCIFFYWAFGMSWFDAVCYGFATISTGGYAPHGASIAFYPHVGIYIVSIIFMFLGGTNFSLHFLAFRKLQFRAYWQNTEFRYYIYFCLFFSALIAIVLIGFHQ
jgi:trk system potassium uptake protein TrkH